MEGKFTLAIVTCFCITACYGIHMYFTGGNGIIFGSVVGAMTTIVSLLAGYKIGVVKKNNNP